MELFGKLNQMRMGGRSLLLSFEMASGSQQIVVSTKAMDDISKATAAQTQTVSAATEEQSATMEEIAASSQMLAKLAAELTMAVHKFKI